MRTAANETLATSMTAAIAISGARIFEPGIFLLPEYRLNSRPIRPASFPAFPPRGNVIANSVPSVSRALHVDVAAVRFDDLLRDREAEAGVAVGAGAGGVGLEEAVEDAAAGLPAG